MLKTDQEWFEYKIGWFFISSHRFASLTKRAETPSGIALRLRIFMK